MYPGTSLSALLSLYHPYYKSYQVDAIIIPILGLGKLSYTEVKLLTQGHKSVSCHLIPEPMMIFMMLQRGGEQLYSIDYTILGYTYVI